MASVSDGLVRWRQWVLAQAGGQPDHIVRSVWPIAGRTRSRRTYGYGSSATQNVLIRATVPAGQRAETPSSELLCR
jgi:hypothetical protein